MKLRTRVIVNFVAVIALFGVLCAALGTVIINRVVVGQAQRRVTLDLRAAWSVLESRLRDMELVLGTLAPGDRVRRAYEAEDPRIQAPALEIVRRMAGLDFLGLTDRTGRVLLRARAPDSKGDSLANDPIVLTALGGQAARGVEILSQERLRAEGGNLDERAFMVFEPTPKAKPRAKRSETSGMAMVAAAPVRNQDGVVVGALYAGILLNRNNELVDDIRSIVFKDEIYKGRPLGTVTIFQWDVRVATNVTKADGNRALGTRVSAEVYDQVLENNRSWYNRAFVVNDWYLSAYDPIHDFDDRTVGILYVGVLAQRYDDIRRDLWAMYGALSALLAVVVMGVGVLFARRLTEPLDHLYAAAEKVAEGDLMQSVPVSESNDEVGNLTRAFNVMTASLRDRDERLRRANEELARTNKELQQLNANYLDLLGFVSHELKNTLGVVFTAARALDAGLVGPLTPEQARLARSIRRSIDAAVTMTRHYLDLAHIEQGELRANKCPIDLVADVVQPVLEELSDRATERGVRIVNELPDSAPLNADPALLRVVYKNLIDNALKYGRQGGIIRLGFSRKDDTYELEVWNEGEGLPKEKLERLFQKFVHFSEDDGLTRRGTGLGLFITREIILKHGGDIRADSKQGEWMSFTFTLPTPSGERAQNT